MIKDIELQASTFGQNEKVLYQLQRDLALKRELYNDLVERFEMAKLTRSLGVFEQEKRVKIIDRPYTPSGPSNLPTILYAIAGVIGGIGFGIGMAIIAELCDTSIRRKDEIATLSTSPVLSRIPPQPVKCFNLSEDTHSTTNNLLSSMSKAN